jgi:hypothetical protein
MKTLVYSSQPPSHKNWMQDLFPMALPYSESALTNKQNYASSINVGCSHHSIHTIKQTYDLVVLVALIISINGSVKISSVPPSENT